MQHPELQTFWQEHIKQHKRLGISAAAYAKQHSLSPKQFYYWREKLGGKKPSKLVPIVKCDAAKQRVTFAIDINGDVVISGANREQVAQVVSALLR